MLAGVGVTELEERVYAALVRTGAASPDELGSAVDAASADVDRALCALGAKGLASRQPGRVVRYVPAPPEVAIEALVAQRQAELAQAQLAATELSRQLRESPRRASGAELVEVVNGREALGRRFEQLQRSATREVIAFDKPPYAAEPGINPVELELLERGIAYRAVYDRESLSYPGQLEWLAQAMAAGEDARIGHVTMKLAIADRRLALLPIALGEADVADAALLVHSSGLLEALALLFESVWRQAIPAALALDGGSGIDGDMPLSREDRELLVLLASGLKDEAIARQLGLGDRTVRRRVSRLGELLGARTRFQLGIQAAKRGLL